MHNSLPPSPLRKVYQSNTLILTNFYHFPLLPIHHPFIHLTSYLSLSYQLPESHTLCPPCHNSFHLDLKKRNHSNHKESLSSTFFPCDGDTPSHKNRWCIFICHLYIVVENESNEARNLFVKKKKNQVEGMLYLDIHHKSCYKIAF